MGKRKRIEEGKRWKIATSTERNRWSSASTSMSSGVSNWMHSNRLELNSDKTEVLQCTTGWQQHQLSTTALLIDGVQVTPVTSIRNLDIFIDSDLVMQSHVQRTVSRCFAPSTASDPQLGANGHVTIIGGRSGAIHNWPQKQQVGWSSNTPGTSVQDAAA